MHRLGGARPDAAAQRRHEWLDANVGTFTKRDDLVQRIAERQAALGRGALDTQPGYLIDLVGPVPRDPVGRSRWAHRAAAVEAYRERWNADPDTLRHAPQDGLQRRDWRHTLDTVKLLNQLDTPRRDLGLDAGLGLEI